MKKRATSKADPEMASIENRYRLELDLHLFFSPLMHEGHNGIILTRTIDLPFPPSSKIFIGGRSIEGIVTPPLGYLLNNIIWDVDREVFLAKTVECISCSPLATVPMDIEMQLDNGWQLGSWQKFYDRTWKSPVGGSLQTNSLDLDWDNEDELLLLETTNASKRPEQFNKLFGAIVRMLFMLRNNEEVGYAMYKTKKFYRNESEYTQEYSHFIDEFSSMDYQDQEKVRRNVMKQTAKFA